MGVVVRRILFWGGAVAALVVALVYAFWPRPLAVDIGVVSRGPMHVTVNGEGQTRVHDVYELSAPLAGEVLRIDGEVGDPVVAGETVVATIRPMDPDFLNARTRAQAQAEISAAEAALSLAKAEVAKVEAELDFAESELNRAKALRERGTISQRGLEQAELDLKTKMAALETVKAELRVRRFQLANARARLIEPGGDVASDGNCCIEVRAPVSGRILKVMRKSQGVVAAGTGLVEIGNPEDLEVVVDFLSTDAVKIEPGATVIIDEWGGDGTLNALVRRVEPYGFTKVSALGIEEQRVNVVIEFAENPDRLATLGHGYRVEARVVIWRDADVVKVPISALFRVGGRWAVFVDEGGAARQVTVQVGHMNTVEAEVIDGLAEGAEVVLHPSDRVTDGALITARPNSHQG